MFKLKNKKCKVIVREGRKLVVKNVKFSLVSNLLEPYHKHIEIQVSQRPLAVTIWSIKHPPREMLVN